MNPIARTPPQWVTGLVREHGGEFRHPWLVMTKSLTRSDLDINQNRFLIPSECVKRHLIPMLSEAEKDAASLLHMPTMRRNTPSTSRVQGRMHGGLEVTVYARNKFRFSLMLTCWDATRAAVIKGPREYRRLLIWSSLRENDEVEMWGFRQGEEGKLCFAFGKRER